MAQIKYTKMELRSQQIKLSQLEKYLPTLQLKKAMLQLEINQVILELEHLSKEMHTRENKVAGYQRLLTAEETDPFFHAVEIETIHKHFENIAGVDIPIFEDISFKKPIYFLFDTPFWFEDGIQGVQNLIETREKRALIREKKRLLEKELREVSIRVNLFEKIMIPRVQDNIKRIKIFLGDQQLAAVSQAKASKRKILLRKKKHDY